MTIENVMKVCGLLLNILKSKHTECTIREIALLILHERCLLKDNHYLKEVAKLFQAKHYHSPQTLK